MPSPLKILLIEDEQADFLLIDRQIRRSALQAELRWVRDSAELTAALHEDGWDLILSDYRVAGLDFTVTLESLKASKPGVPIILVSGSIGEETAVELLKSGLSDFVLKDRLFRLLPAIERSLGEQAEKQRRIKAEKNLAASEQLMRAVLDGTSDSVFVKDREGRYLLCNQAAADFIGRPVNEIIGQDDNALFSPETAAMLQADNRTIMELGRLLTQEEQLTARAGKQQIFSVTKGPVFDQQGNINGLFGIARDVTERKQTQVLLKEQEERYRSLSQEYRALLDNVPDGIVHLSPQFEVRWVNAAAQQMFQGKSGAELRNQVCHLAFWNREDSCDSCPVERSLASRQNEIACLSSLETGREFEIRAVPVIGQSGELDGVIEIIRDVTTNRQLEEQYRQAQKMETIGTLAGGIAHDFNNILSAILGYGEMALEALAMDHPARKSVRTIIEAGLRASHLTKDLLLFSRKQGSKKIPVDVNAVIVRIEKLIRRIIGEDIQCDTQLVKQPLMVFADGHQLEQVLMNFATNARDAMPVGGRLSIAAECVQLDQAFVAAHGLGAPGPYARITVTDTGKGMEQKILDKIFEPFFTTKEVGKGTGLGLAVVYGIIREHQGHIEAASEPGKGTTFRFFLPLIAEQEPAAPIPPAQLKPPGGRETILLAEDEPAVRELFASILEQNGYTVIEAVNGEDGVRKFEEHWGAIDLLLFDLVMPKMNGKLAMEAIRKLQPDIKGVFVSGYAPENIRHKELTDLRTTVLYKPVAIAELLQAVRQALDAPSALPSALP